MPTAVQQRIASDRASWASLTAGTLKAETYPLQVQRDSLVLDGNADGSYSDGVKHDPNDDALSERGRGNVYPGSATQYPGASPPLRERTESDRLAFLRRVQYVDPRERRA